MSKTRWHLAHHHNVTESPQPTPPHRPPQGRPRSHDEPDEHYHDDTRGNGVADRDGCRPDKPLTLIEPKVTLERLPSMKTSEKQVRKPHN